jgi:hypothetical protein
MGSILRDSNVPSLLVLRKLNPLVVLRVLLGLCYFIIRIMLSRGRNKKPSPATEAEKLRAWNGGGRHEAALLLDLAVNREATGRRDRAIDAIVDCVVSSKVKIFCPEFGPGPD